MVDYCGKISVTQQQPSLNTKNAIKKFHTLSISKRGEILSCSSDNADDENEEDKASDVFMDHDHDYHNESSFFQSMASDSRN